MANNQGKILIVDDNEELLIAFRFFLSKHFSIIDTIKNPNLIPEKLRTEVYDIILLDMNFSAGVNSGNEGIYWMKQILEKDSKASVILITAYGDVELAVHAMKEGAVDFIQKSWDEEKILSTILSAYKLRLSKLKIENLEQKQKHLSEKIDSKYNHVIGESAAMKSIFNIVDKVANTDANILILGENGTGKEVIAREIHRKSDRANEVFVNVDIGSLQENLFESELFGHVKGSFTDAKEDRVGRFEIASGGTLFLDEIGNLPLSLQAKLLTAIQNKEILRIGSNKPIPVDIRLICATNNDIDKMLEEKTFREDLLYRINTIKINLPNLKERKEDINLLADFFLKKYTDKYNKYDLKFSQNAIAKMNQHSWPGNIRELQHAIEKSVILCDGKTILPIHFWPEGEKQVNKTSASSFNLDENEKILIEKAIQKYKGNISSAAKELGINRSTLYKKWRNMKFSRFRLSIAFQLLLIAATILAFFWTTDQEYMLITSSSLVIIWVLQLVYLFWYLQKVNRDLIKFITAIKYDDVSLSFNKDKKVDKSFKELHSELNNIIQNISEVRSDKEIEHQYFQNTIKHIGTGILAFDESGKIEICNDAALNLLNRHNIKNLSELNNTQKGLADNFKDLKPGNAKLIKLNIDNEIVLLSVKAANFKIKDKKIKLLSLQNIKSEIDQSEVASWQKLIRVLTHEIMNSVSPIKLLSSSLIEMFEENDKIKTINELDEKTIKDSVLGLKTIQKRSAGLSNFVETYKNVTQIPKVNLSDFKICSLFDHINTLLKNDLEQKSIQFNFKCIPTELSLNADEKLIEQVLINLIKNATEALINCKSPTIQLECELVENHTIIKVIDNGAGISSEVLDNIFIPFFTTKEKGSGIGLSLSRQIMHLHGGNISVKSIPFKETTFTLKF